MGGELSRRTVLATACGMTLTVAGCTGTATDARTTDRTTTVVCETATDDAASSSTDVSGEIDDVPSSVTVEKHFWEKVTDYDHQPDGEDEWGVVGVVRNDADEEREIYVEARFYDDRDIRLEDFMDGDERTQSGETFSFVCPLLDSNPAEVVRYELSVWSYPP